MRDSRMRSQIAVLKCLEFWRENRGVQNLRTNSFKGREKFEIQQGYLYFTDCELCKLKNRCAGECKHRDAWKLFVMKVDEGVVKVRKMNANAKLPIRGTSGSAGHNLAATQSAVVPAHGKCLVKIGLAMALPLVAMVEFPPGPGQL